MKYIECPATLDPRNPNLISVFMAGGISGCPDWQTQMKELLKYDASITLVNPRRSNFDMSNKNMTVDQIYWEHKHLEICDAVMFWFPKETLCPITLFELGVQSQKPGRKLFVACHPEYQRKLDVEVQLSLSRPDIIVGDSIEGMALNIVQWLDQVLIQQ